MIDDDLGRWLAAHLGVAPEPPDPELGALVGFALRRNTRRAHLPVSRVLGKHVPAHPHTVLAAAHRLAALVPVSRDAVVLGFAENATGLAHLVADALDADHVLHSTRRFVPGAATLDAFEERHSHASRHLLLPDRPERWSADAPLVMVDDELSTGHTVTAALRVLHGARPRARYVVATLVDLRGPDDDALARAAGELGVRVDVVALARATLRSPPDVLDRAAALVATRSVPAPALAARRRHDGGATPPPPSAPRRRRDGLVGDAERLERRRRDDHERPDPAGPGRGDSGAGSEDAARAPGTHEALRLPLDGAPEGARHGLDRADRAALDRAIAGAVPVLDAALGPDAGRVLVLGCEELHHLPVRLAAALADAGRDVAVAGTTRSPVVVVDEPGYPVRSALCFPAHDAGLGRLHERHAYGLARGGFDTVVLVVDDDARTPTLYRGLVARLREVAPRVVEVAVPTRRPARAVPAARGPAFGTFAPDEVGWLVSDVSGAMTATPPAEREDALRGGRHYSETLPEEHAPDPEYDAAAARALDRAAPAVATSIGRLTDRLLAACGPAPVLVSLARAGTPVGVLVRRWAARMRGVELPHYSCSVVRGRGLDPAALAALLAAHDPASLVFLDGWTGTGSIVDEVARSVGDPTVAVLADPGHCAPLYGTREDLLVPSACLTATVCGLVSRTVRREGLPGDYDGAVFHLELAAVDRTAAFLDTVSAHFAPVHDTPAGDPPDRRGPHYAAALAAEHGRRVKAGIGETTRALLRRVPTAVLVADDDDPDLEHLRLLCRRRGVPVGALPASVDGVARPYRAVALL